MSTEIVLQEQQSALMVPDMFQQLVQQTTDTVSANSQRVYAQTYRAWFVWCQGQGVNPFDLRAANVRQYLTDQEVGKVTRQRQLSALRKIARVLAITQKPEYRAAYESLILLKVPTEGATHHERNKRALSPAQVERIINVWNSPTKISIRNRAILAVLFFVGMRRSEACSLKWSDIDLEDGTIHIRHGKGDKDRDSAIAGDFPIRALMDWKAVQTNGGKDHREYVFCTVLKSDTLGADSPISDDTVYKVVKETETKTGVKFSPHDARRTLITEALIANVPLAEVQSQAGHAQASTTLRYAKASDAKSRRTIMRLRYGSGE